MIASFIGQFIQMLPLLSIVFDDFEAVRQIITIERQIKPILVGRLGRYFSLTFLGQAWEGTKRIRVVGLVQDIDLQSV